MAHFAELDDNNVVKRVIVVNNEDIQDENGNEVESIGVEFCHNTFGGRWVQTSYNNNFRFNYAGVGYTYDTNLNAFIEPKPYPSWVLNLSTCKWEPPVPVPDPDKRYRWDEGTTSWVEVPL